MSALRYECVMQGRAEVLEAITMQEKRIGCPGAVDGVIGLSIQAAIVYQSYTSTSSL